MTKATAPIPVDPELASWNACAAFLAEATALGAKFAIRGVEVELQAPVNFPPALLARWEQHREISWEFLGADRDDIEAQKFFSHLGVRLIHVVSTDRVPAALARM